MSAWDAGTLREAVDARLTEDGRAWLDSAEARVHDDPAAIAVLFPAVGRSVGRGPLRHGTSVSDVHAWTVDDGARALLLSDLGPAAAGELPLLYRHGDGAERRGVLRALELLTIDETLGIGLVQDALRTNDVGLIAAAMGPYAAAHLSDDAFAQAVLKCVFVGVPLAGVAGLPERVTPELSAMLARYVHERIAAGRDVPADVWPVVDRHPPATELEAIEAELVSIHPDRRSAAEAALASRRAAATEHN